MSSIRYKTQSCASQYLRIISSWPYASTWFNFFMSGAPLVCLDANFIFSLPTLCVITLLFIYTSIPTVFKKGPPKIKGTYESSTISITTKLHGMVILPTCKDTSFNSPMRTLIKWYANWITLLVGLSSKLCFFVIESGIRLTLAPKSASATLSSKSSVYNDIKNEIGLLMELISAMRSICGDFL